MGYMLNSNYIKRKVLFSPYINSTSSHLKGLARSKRRHRQKISRSSSSNLLCLFKSRNHLYAQVLNPSKSFTLLSESTINFPTELALKGNTSASSPITGVKVAMVSIPQG